LTLLSFQCGQGYEERKGLLECIAASKKPIFEGGIRGVGDNTIVRKYGFFNKKVVSRYHICAPTGEAVLSAMVDEIPFSCSRLPYCPRWMEERQKGV